MKKASKVFSFAIRGICLEATNSHLSNIPGSNWKKKVRNQALDGCSACAAGALRGVLRNLNLPRLPRLPVTKSEQMAQFWVGFLWPPGRSRHSPPKCRTLWCHAWVHRMITGSRRTKIEDLLFRTVDAAGTVQMAAQVPSTSKFEVSNPVSKLAFK